MRLLDQINSPQDLRALHAEEVRQLADEIRDEMISVVSKNGGHLASNLGVVELTIALHRVFDAPHDKIIWDVGHQSYVHKLLTGRREQFASLRCHNGLSGFPRLEESVYDAFGAGHSSTSISAAVGYAQARDLQGENYSVAAVIGDGSIGSGMAYEALNHAGSLDSDLIVVLNDNEMSISKNVGAMASYLNRIRTVPGYKRKKKAVKNRMSQIPLVGRLMASVTKKIKDGIKFWILGERLFEELGFAYLGPVNGHDIGKLEELLRRARQRGGPVLVHITTQKGKGYEPAERNPDIFHGIGPFDRSNGSAAAKKGVPTYTQVFGQTLCELAKEDARVVAITAAMCGGTGLDEFKRLYPERFFDVGIAEPHAVTFAAGLALGGMKPVVAIYSTFCQRAFDQILHDVCLQKIPVVFAVDRAGLVGEDGCTHHGIFDIGFFRMMPGLPVMAPADEVELARMLSDALAMEGPVVVRYPRGQGLGVKEDDVRPLEFGRAELCRKGTDVTLIGCGATVAVCRRAAEELIRMGISAGVINLRYLNPLDAAMVVAQAKLTGRLITVEDHVLMAGMGSAVAEVIADAGLEGVRLERLGYQGFVQHGATDVLQREEGVCVERVVRLCASETRRGQEKGLGIRG
ncbi:MAG: 1-deoxy-D-xylulose-5-phosphate synthase [Gracilibacteraceae bacterium]|nr:1-deoxy-D-xylulose-5-phosphate synthase [Gracilibacteraceae bacterium]